ncbi:methylamine utilization protein [Peristeroidobacter soli]|uniref:methylamine utilization protein n=1 Tax=Peristeroidobacter soli TaxID=2497877 RepID=UPI00101BDA75|nr:methylamine utilization protein [Peristeroidobacter soli]
MNPPPHRVSVVLLGLALAGPAASANELTVNVSDNQGQPARNVVVVATPKAPVSAPARSPTMVEMDQVDRQFAPYVLAIQTGTRVLFSNNDSVAHQVYSFSPPKRFELALYHGKPREPVLFDKPGIVTVGCNIHDNMIGYLYITESPWFGTTASDGVWKARDIPAGEYELQVWTPLLPPHEWLQTQSVVVGETSARASFKLKRGLRPEPVPIKDKRVRDY